MSINELMEKLEALAKAATPGPYTSDEGRGIWCPNAKIGGVTKIFDIRGWGYFTGQGHGALGLSEAEGIAQQVANGAFVAACSPDAILTLIEALRGERERADAVLKVLDFDGGKDAYHNLGGAIIDIEQKPIGYVVNEPTVWECDDVCLKTLKRVESQLAAVAIALKTGGAS